MNGADVDSIAVLGAGDMGHGIAEVAALAGFDVNLRDVGEELAREGCEQIEWSLGKLVETDRVSEADADAGLEVESQAFGHLVNTDDLMAGIAAFAGDEEPEFEGK